MYSTHAALQLRGKPGEPTTPCLLGNLRPHTYWEIYRQLGLQVALSALAQRWAGCHGDCQRASDSAKEAKQCSSMACAARQNQTSFVCKPSRPGGHHLQISFEGIGRGDLVLLHCAFL